MQNLIFSIKNFYLNKKFSNTKKFELASKMFISALKINPENASINNNLGNIYFELGDIQKSLNFALKELKLSSGIKLTVDVDPITFN